MKLGKEYLKEQEVEIAVKKSIPTVRDLDNDFDAQLRDFKSNTSYKERFRRCILRDEYLLEIFMYKPNKKKNTELFIQGLGGLKNTRDIEIPTNLFKVIKVGTTIENSLYKEGDLVLLPYSMTTGSMPNPKHAMYHQLDDSNFKPVVDDEIPQYVPTFVASLGNNMFLPPDEYETEIEDARTFCIHPDLIVARYDY